MHYGFYIIWFICSHSPILIEVHSGVVYSIVSIYNNVVISVWTRMFMV